MKKILFVIDSLHCGGAEKSLVTLLNNIDYNKLSVDLLMNTKGGDFEEFVPEQVNLIYKNIFQNSNKLKIFLMRLKFWILKKIDFKNKFHSSQQLWKVINKRLYKHSREYDIAIAYGQGFPTYYVAEKISANRKYSWLNTDHQKIGYNAAFDYTMYSVFNKIIAVSEESKFSLEKAMNTIGEKLPIEIIKDISDKDFILEMSKKGEALPVSPKGTLKVLTVCRLDPVKGLSLAIEACNVLCKKGIKIKWYVIGEGGERDKLESLINSKNLSDHFILLGFKNNPYAFMQDCDIYVQTSFTEGLCLTLQEAVILRKPIVTTNFPTAASIVVDNTTGLIVDHKPQEIALAVLKYVENNELKENMIFNLSRQKNNDKEKSLALFYNLID